MVDKDLYETIKESNTTNLWGRPIEAIGVKDDDLYIKFKDCKTITVLKNEVFGYGK